MPELNITDFSCLDSAHFKLSPVNVLIGPQGSGKSVTTKLFYFCTDLMTSFISSSERGISFNDYKKKVSLEFSTWFPPQAWGPGRFNINYTAGKFYIRILRRLRNTKPTDDVSIVFSEWFADVYDQAVETFESARKTADISGPSPRSFSEDPTWRVREQITIKLSRALGDEFIGGQTFVPAGRAFFTSIGRLVAGFEHAGALDPVTLKFARLFANLRDRFGWQGIYQSRTSEGNDRRKRFMTRLFGGEVKREGETEFVETSDGRKVPFGSLSSGQQELLPMWSLIDLYAQQDEFLASRKNAPKPNRHLIYIEEPEAHLFPSAQSTLMEFLIGSLVSRDLRSLVLTTHSPYILSKLNVFLKAGQLARRKKRNQDINEIVPRECWLNERQLSAFAIEARNLRDLIDEEYGLIEDAYLDSISQVMSDEYSRLVAIEAAI
jgi:hypothetical protein